MKRFTATEKWGKEWYQELKPKLKCLWQFICDHADPCGVWEANFALASFQIGEKVTEVDLEKLGDRIHKLPSGKYLIPSFIEFQYGKLSEMCPAHKPVFRAMEKNRVSVSLLHTLTDRVADRLLDKDKEEDKEEEGVASPAAVDKAKGTMDDVKSFCREEGIPETDGESRFHAWEANGWKINGKPMKCWRSQIRSWWISGYLPSQKGRQGNYAPLPVKVFKDV